MAALKSLFFKSLRCGHPSKGWSCSLWLNMHDHEGDYRITRKASSLARQYKFLIYWSLHFPLLREASSRSLTWVLSECLVPLHLTTSTVVPGQTPSVPGTQGPIASSSLWNRPPNLGVVVLRCHHYIIILSIFNFHFILNMIFTLYKSEYHFNWNLWWCY